MMSKNRAFTLAEVLIALALLGVIAMFTIPKILRTHTEHSRRVAFQETLGALGQVFYQGLMREELNENTSSAYFIQRLNGVKVCDTNSSTQGCWNDAKQGTVASPENSEPGIVFANKTAVVGFNNFFKVENSGSTGNGLVNAFYIDWNGEEPPNVLGDDQLTVLYCANPPGSSCQLYSNVMKGGHFAPYNNGNYTAAQNQANAALYQTIFLKD